MPLAAAALWAMACGRDHDLGVTSGAGGAASSSSKASSGHGGASGTSVTSSSSGMTPEPDGPTKLTIVNGVNDYGAIRVCFEPYPDGDPTLTPWPSAAAGMPFARAAVITPISPTLPAGKDIQPVILAGDLSTIAGKTCAEALALAGSGGGGAGGGDAGGPPPPIVATPLGVIPAAVFTEPRSILLVPFGCLGGPGHAGPSATLGCGSAYSPSNPTADLVVLGMSRIADGQHINLQVVNASAALQPSDVRLRTGFDTGMEWQIAPMLPTGAIAPKPPFHLVSVANIGPLDKTTVKTYLPGQMFQTSATPLPDAINNGLVTQAEIVDGTDLVLVAVGAYPGVNAMDFWHKLTFTLVKADP